MCPKGVSSRYFFLGTILLLSYIASITRAQDPPADPPADAPTGNGSGNGTFPLPEALEEMPMTPEEQTVVEAIGKLVNDQCVLILGDCWLLFKVKKPWLKDEKRLALCLRQTQGFMMCSQMKPEDAETAKTAAEERVKKARELAIEEAQKKEEMAEKAKEREEQSKIQQEKLLEERARRQQEREEKKAAAATQEGDEKKDSPDAEKSFDSL